MDLQIPDMRWWRCPLVGYLLALCVLLFTAGPAQAVGYSAALTTAYPPQAISASAPQVVWSSCNSAGTPSAYILCDDGVSTKMPIGFSFTFAGTAYNNWSMSTNGVIFSKLPPRVTALVTAPTPRRICLQHPWGVLQKPH